MQEEYWREIPGYEGLYEASNFGRVRSKEGKKTHTDYHGNRQWKSRIMKTKKMKDGCIQVSLWKNGSHKDHLVYRLIATAFLGVPPNEKYTVNHKDGNRENNSVENLEWMSLADNIRHGFRNGLYPTKQVVLKNDAFAVALRSEAEASRFLKRNHGYVSNRLKRKHNTCKSKNGVVYEIIVF